jgi:putative transposase
MAYPLRVQIPGQPYHVYAGGVAGCQLFRDEFDFAAFLFLLELEIRRSGWTVLMYTLMTTHFHLLVILDEQTLSSGMQNLMSAYARAYNRAYGRRGALWQRRFNSVPIESERQLVHVIRYIAWNAPKVGMASRPEEYRWCNYGAAIGARAADPLIDEAALLRPFGDGA